MPITNGKIVAKNAARVAAGKKSPAAKALKKAYKDLKLTKFTPLKTGNALHKQMMKNLGGKKKKSSKKKKASSKKSASKRSSSKSSRGSKNVTDDMKVADMIAQLKADGKFRSGQKRDRVHVSAAYLRHYQ